MPLKGHGTGDATVLAAWDAGLTWTAFPEEAMGRTSHAVRGDGSDEEPSLWLVDPVDSTGLDAILAERGRVAGIVVTSSWHARDADLLAKRYEVPVYLHEAHDGLASTVEASVRRFKTELADTGFRAIRVETTFWTEVGLYHPDRETLIVGDTLAATDRYTAEDERLAVLPVYRRIAPPRAALADLDVRRVLVGHGGGVHEQAEAALEFTLDGARTHAPSLALRNFPAFLRSGWVALRD